MDEDDGGLGPRLGGAGQNGVRYFLESILDPHAVSVFPYQSVTLRLKDGRQVSGIVEAESESAWLMRQQEARVWWISRRLRRNAPNSPSCPMACWRVFRSVRCWSC